MDDPAILEREFRVQVVPKSFSFNPFINELVGYGIASAAALGVDVIILKVLVDQFGWHYLLAATLSFVAGACVAYWLSVRLAFKSHRVKNPFLEFTCFAALGLVGVLVNGVVISIGVRVVGLSIVPSKLVAAICTFATNFALRRAVLFSRKSVIL